MRSPGSIATQSSTLFWLPSINRATDATIDLQIGAQSELGAMLRGAGFRPTAYIEARHAMFTVAANQ